MCVYPGVAACRLAMRAEIGWWVGLLAARGGVEWTKTAPYLLKIVHSTESQLARTPRPQPVGDADQRQQAADPEQHGRVLEGEALELGAQVDGDRGDRRVADRRRPGVAPERNPGGPGCGRDQAEGDDRQQPHRQQQGDAAALDHCLHPLEALAAEQAVQQRPPGPETDRVTEQAGEDPTGLDQEKAPEEPVGEPCRGVDQLGRIEDDGVEELQGDDDQRPCDPQVGDLAADLGGVAVDGGRGSVAKRRHRQHDHGGEEDPRHGDRHPRQRGARLSLLWLNRSRIAPHGRQYPAASGACR